MTQNSERPPTQPPRDGAATDYEYMWENVWGDLQDHGPQHRHKYRLILNLLRKARFGSVLDVGCGTGGLLEMVSRHFPDVALNGVDIAQHAVDLAAKRVHGSFQTLNLSKGALNATFDLVMCCDVIEHIDDDQTAIANLAKMAGRYLLISTPRGRMRPSEHLLGHVRNYQTQELFEKLATVGFAPKAHVAWGFPFYSPIYREVQEFFTPAVGEGHWDWRKRVIAEFLYRLYWLNLNRFGDVLIVLFERRS